MNTKRFFLGGFLLAAPLAAADSQAESTREKPAAPSQAGEETPLIQNVDPSNGIDVNEARAIADAYFQQEYGDCGGPDDVVLKGRTWVFRLVFGVTGDRIKETIRVDAKLGGVWTEGGPRYRDFKSFRERKAVPARREQKG